MYFRILNEMGKREKWTVKVPVEMLRSCCDERMRFHTNRLEFWTTEREQSESLLRSDGIKVKHFAVTGGQRTEAQLDPSMAARVAECEQRQKANKDSMNRFRAFKSMLSLMPQGTEMELNADDILYFNLNNADPEGESNDE